VWYLSKDRGLAVKFKVEKAARLVVIYPDETEIMRGQVETTPEVAPLLTKILAKLKEDNPTEWLDSVEEAKKKAAEEDKMLLVFFCNSSRTSKSIQSTLELWRLGPLRRKLVLLKLEFKKDAPPEFATELGIKKAPYLVLVDVEAEEEKKRVLAKTGSSKKIDAVVAWIKSGQKKYDKAKDKR
jgi:hypothetical protein